MKKFGIKTIAILLVFCLCAHFTAFAATNAVEMKMSVSNNAQVGKNLTLKITINKPSAALAGLEFSLKYDSAFVAPVVTANSEEKEEMSSFITKMPQGWEQMCSHSASEKKYYFRFSMPHGGNAYLNSNEGLVLEIPFKVISAGVFKFQITDGDIIAVGADSNLTLYGGKGTTLSVVAAGEDEKFAVELGNSDTAPTNGIYYLDMEITNLGDSEGIIGLEFALEYDKSVFKPYITANDDYQMDGFMISTPKSSWEQLCTHYGGQSKYILRFAAIHAESLTQSEILAKGKSMRISVPFYVIGAEGDVASFKISSASAIGLNNANGFISGRGDVKTVSVEGSTANGFVLGDVNLNGKIDARDYLLLKRGFFGTYSLNGQARLAGDVNRNGKIDARDYLLLKRAFFGTYQLTK